MRSVKPYIHGIHACWYNEIYSAVKLEERGKRKRYQSRNRKHPVEPSFICKKCCKTQVLSSYVTYVMHIQREAIMLVPNLPSLVRLLSVVVMDLLLLTEAE